MEETGKTDTDFLLDFPMKPREAQPFCCAAGLEDDTIQKDKLDRTKRSERERIENISPCAECYSKGRVRFGRGTNDLLTINHGSFWRTRSHT